MIEKKILVTGGSGFIGSHVADSLEENGYQADDDLVAHMFEVAKNQRRLMDDDEVHHAISEYNQNN